MAHSRFRVTTILVLFLFFQLVLAQRAEAYLDPGTGSYVFQMLIAVFLSAAFTIKHYWRNLKAFFGRRRTRKMGDDTTTS